MLLQFMAFFAVLIIFFIFLTPLLLQGKDHSEFDLPSHELTGTRSEQSEEHKAAAALIVSGMNNPPQGSRSELLQLLRDDLDARGAALAGDAEIILTDAGGVDAEWVLAPGTDKNRRMLYIHGGGYMTGSAKSHRLITSRLSQISNAAVLAINYRLMPEHPRRAGIEDSFTAYRWILEHGPDGNSPVKTLLIAGDSAGGNLALTTIARARDAGLPAAQAAIALSPQTDATLSSPSLVKNIDSDVMQGKAFGPMVKAPKWISLGIWTLINRLNPANPLVSPLLGELSNLPPTLIQVSQAEMFYGEALRYVNKANKQGSPAILQTWPFMMHVWQAFQVPEAEEAFAKMASFIADHT